MMGYLLLFIVLALVGFALYSWFMQGSTPDDREDRWWIFEKQSGPFHWRKRWMGTYADPFDENEETMANIRVKQKHNDRDEDKLVLWDPGKIYHVGQEIFAVRKDKSTVYLSTAPTNEEGAYYKIVAKSTENEHDYPADKWIIEPSLDLMSNIRVKQRLEDWDDVSMMYFVKRVVMTKDNRGNIRITLYNKYNKKVVVLVDREVNWKRLKEIWGNE